MGKHNCTSFECKLFSSTFPPIMGCYETEDGSFMTYDDGFDARVNYCPICGAKASLQMEKMGP